MRRGVRTGASRIPPDVAAAIHQCWPDGIVHAFATDESYFHEIHARLERDLRNIRSASLRWRTSDTRSDARSDEDDDWPLVDEWQSYDLFFLTPDDESFQVEVDTDGMEGWDDPQGEGRRTACAGEGWIGCAVGISLVAPYAVMNLCTYSCDEDGTTSIPDVESFIYSEETRQRVDTDQYYREILSQEMFQKLEALRVEIASILAKHRLRILDQAVLNLRVPGLRASADVFLEEPLRVQDAFFFRGV